MSRRSSDDFPIFFLLFFLPMMLVLSEGDDSDLMSAMTAKTADEAVDHGMRPELSRYFTACQSAHNITPGDIDNTTRQQAKDMEQCLFDRHEARENRHAPQP